jgi:hypothetical protein
MSIGITSNRNYIDTTAINEVSKQIFQKAETNSFDINSTDLTKFRRPEVGVDLYSRRTDLDSARQIAIRNAGLDINLNENFIANIQYLNTQAAQGINKAQKTMEGKVIAPVAEGEKSEIKNIFNSQNNIELNNSKNLDKDKRGSNPFSFYSMNSNKEKQEEVINIFA